MMNLGLFAQVPEGRYFTNIEGTIWQSSIRLDQKTIPRLEEFGLTIVEREIGSLTSNNILWSFDETLKIESYNAQSKETAPILECTYVHNEKNKTLKLLIEGQELEFSYVPVSTGAYVGFRKKKK